MNSRKSGRNSNNFFRQSKWAKRGAMVMGGAGFGGGFIFGTLLDICTSHNDAVALAFTFGLIGSGVGGILGSGADLATSRQPQNKNNSSNSKKILNHLPELPKNNPNFSKAAVLATVLAGGIGIGYVGSRFFSEEKPHLTDSDPSNNSRLKK